MGRPGERHLRNGALENNAVVGQGIEGRGLDVGGAVAAHMISADRVDGDEDDIRRGLPGRVSNGKSLREQDRDTGQEIEKSSHSNSLNRLLWPGLLCLAHFLISLCVTSFLC